MMKKTHLMAQKYKRGFNQAAGRRQRWQRAGRPESTERTWTRSKSFAHRSEDVFREDEVLFVLRFVVGESPTVSPDWRRVPDVHVNEGGKKR